MDIEPESHRQETHSHEPNAQGPNTQTSNQHTETTPRSEESKKGPSTWQTFRAAWRERGTLGDRHLDTTQRQFLPAALEIQDTPPSPAGHWLMWLLLSLFTIGVAWACLGKVDIVVTAPGRIVPSGQVKLVQAPQAGTISSILVKEGERVEQGQTLIRFDPTYAEADDQRIRAQLEDTQLQLVWREALENWLEVDRDNAQAAFEHPTSLPMMDAVRAEALYTQHRDEITARLLSLSKELSANEAEQRSVNAEQERAEATLRVLDERVAAYKALVDRQYGAKVQYLEMLQQQTDLARSLPVLQSRSQQLQESASAIRAQKAATVSELRKQNLLELARLDSERSSLQQEAMKTHQLRQQQLLVAPVTGTVEALAVHTVGGVVSPAQELMKIVPAHATIEVEALLQNKDIGFIREGQTAQVKVDTFNFTKYGLIDAQVLDISNDAIEDQNLGWVFEMRLALEQTSIAVEDKLVKLSPGMAITAEVKTGKRRLIEFFLSPLLRYKQESVRER
ncbi:MAG: HlyD family type I secretion periplasmic adaptor subunit [Pseudomonadota bacterium]